MNTQVRVWDLPTRLFHWALVILVVCLVISGYRGGSAMDWHARFGYAVLALLLFRLVWGIVGGRWSRFRAFLYSPRTLSAYLRGQAHPDHLVGHNPLGALSVFAMMLFLFAQVATGLVGDDEISFTGPLNRFVQSSQGLAATWYHKQVGQWALAALVLLHILAVAYYYFRKRDNLLTAMVHGDKVLPRQVPGSRDDIVSRIGAAVVLSLCSLAVWWIVTRGT